MTNEEKYNGGDWRCLKIAYASALGFLSIANVLLGDALLLNEFN